MTLIETLFSAAQALQPLVSAVWPHLRRLHSERQASQMPIREITNFLDSGLQETYDRLRFGKVDDAWWQGLLRRIENQFVAPDFLRKPALQEWLSQPQVERDFKDLARTRIRGEVTEDEHARSRLRQAYEQRTGERGQFADFPIDVILAVLAAGYLARIEPRLEPVLGFIQESAAESRAEFQHTREQLGQIHNTLSGFVPDSHVVKAHTDLARSELTHVLQRRCVDIPRARLEIAALAQRIGSGDLRHAEAIVQAEVLYWASRLHAGSSETVSAAKTYLSQLRQANPSKETQIIDALIAENEGDVNAALRILRDVANPDGRSTLFAMLWRARGNDAALAWFDEQPNRNEPAFLTTAGWSNLAICLARAGRWEEAVAHLAAAERSHDEWPDLAFVEGVLNAAMLLPLEFRPYALEMNVFHPNIRTTEGKAADRYRDRARQCFAHAAESLAALDLVSREQAAKDWLLWLRLTDPDPETVDAARHDIREGMKIKERAIDLIPFADAFGIPFSESPIQHYLAQRARIGGLTGPEMFARLVLARRTMAPGDFAVFMEQEEGALTIPKAALTGMRIEALVKDGQSTKARHLLEERQSDLVDFDHERLRAMIDLNEGNDPRAQFEGLYRRTNALLDLQNLINHLSRIGDWSALRPLLQELYQREPTIENACRLVQSMQNDLDSDDENILAFLKENSHIVNRSKRLLSAQAWALFHVGLLDDAKTINDNLLRDRYHPSDLDLDINIALQSGQWERFPVIIDREWARREGHNPQTLTQLASLAAEADATSERAWELATLAATKAPNDSKVLINAFRLAFQLGREKDADPTWLSRAAEHSDDEGQLWRVDLRTLAEETMPAQRERAQQVDKALVEGNLPLHVAAGALGSSLSRLLFDHAKRNATEPDGRRRVILPIRSGARPLVLGLQSSWTLGLDITSILVLAELDLLDRAMSAFSRIAIAPDTMVFLINERRRVRFHQPSRADEAQQVRRLIIAGHLRDTPLPRPPTWLVEEVGADFAALLEAARSGAGYVIHPRPIYKLSTFMEEEADLREYSNLVISSIGFARLLFRAGHVEGERHQRAHEYLRLHDHDEGDVNAVSLLAYPLFLTDLCVTYLQTAGILEAACHRNLDLRVHPSLRSDQETIIEANREGEKLAAKLDKIRCTLRDAIASPRSKVAFLKRHKISRDELNVSDPGRPESLLLHFLTDSQPCDAISIDDRFTNRYLSLTDRSNRTISLLCVLDIIQHLKDQTLLSEDEWYSALHNLRQAGFAFIPFDASEFERRLRNAVLDRDDHLIESAELRTIRQTLMRIRSIEMLQRPLEDNFLGGLQLAGTSVIRTIWEDERIPVSQAAELSDWVWRNVFPSPLDWLPAGAGVHERSAAWHASAKYFAALLLPMAIMGQRDEHFRDWVERAVLAPLSPANKDFVGAVASEVREEIERFCSGIDWQIDPAQIAEYLCNRQPPSVSTRLLQDRSLSDKFGLRRLSVVTFGNSGPIDERTLFAAVRKALADKTEQCIFDLEGRELSVALDEEAIRLRQSTNDHPAIDVRLQELLVLSPHPQERVEVLDRVLERLGPAVPDFSALTSAAQERKLTDEEVSNLFNEMANGVVAVHRKIADALKTGKRAITDLVPHSLAYFERFCGPDPGEAGPGEYLEAVLPAYREEIVRRDLVRGLDACFLGALRDDLSPRRWTENVSDDDLWDALVACRVDSSPYPLIAALDLAISRQHDERFRSFAETAVEKLAGDNFPRPDGVDIYELLPLFAELVLHWIHTLDGGAIRPPFWRRLCAWTHAAVLVRLTQQLKIDIQALSNWVHTKQTTAGVYAAIFDLQAEPMYRAAELSREALRDEILGRLFVLRARHGAEGRTVPRGVAIDEAISRRVEQGSPFGYLFPGPLEGHCRPANVSGRSLPDDGVELIENDLAEEHLGKALYSLSYLCQYYDISDSTLSKVRDAVDRISIADDRDTRNEIAKNLTNTCLLAIAKRHTDLARSVAVKALEMAPTASSREDAISLLRAIALASTAFENKDEWASWLRQQLYQLANRIPAGIASRTILDDLREINSVTKAAAGITGRAEAGASAAI